MYPIKSKDHQFINSQLKNIKNDMKIITNNQTISSTVYKIVQDIILNYVKKNNKIVYGGIALNALMKHKTDKELYTKHDIPDIEFYSSNSWQDAKNICDILHNIGFVSEAKEAIHINTLSIFINRFNCCDITFFHQKIIKAFQTVIVNGIKYIHPHHMYTDYINLLNTSEQYTFYDKTIPKIEWIVKNYPFQNKTFNFKLNNKNLLTIPWIYKMIQKKSFILTDSYAVYQYTKHVDIKDHQLSSQLTLLSCELYDDAMYIYNIIMKHNKNVQVIEYYGFSEYIGRKIAFHTDSNITITLIDQNKVAQPFVLKNGIQILDIQSLHKYLLHKILYFNVLIQDIKDINTSKFKKLNFCKQITELDEQCLRKAWDKFYYDRDIIVSKNELFSIFVNNYVGYHISNFYKNHIEFESRIFSRKKNIALKPKYQPSMSKELPQTYPMACNLGQQISSKDEKIMSWI